MLIQKKYKKEKKDFTRNLYQLGNTTFLFITEEAKENISEKILKRNC